MKTKAPPLINRQHGGLVPVKYWQRSFLLTVVPDEAAPYMVRQGKMTYIDTKHAEYTRWFVGFIRGASAAADQAIKRQMN